MQLDRPLSSSKKLIGLTPLIDVVFILLLFFMLTSSFIQWQSMDLMVSTGESAGTTGEPPIMLGMNDAGRPFLVSEPQRVVEVEHLRELLATGDRDVMVTPADVSSIQQVVLLLEQVEALGARSVSVNTRAAP
ncbi:biopolymer transporter ExbD [Marinobacter sp.]|uniref:ExbD/TolR family protein n=1 Tax=Marinobacter sp. TaxID=50741 RepID=UPI001A04CBA2|nr:biopolymer transporter ExbD [Marinobacter sp.]MBE0485621.1 biopolymer transporter ExbD [Marinobacter sp.]